MSLKRTASVALTLLFAADARGAANEDSRTEAELAEARQMIINHFKQLDGQEPWYIEVSPTEVVPAFFHPSEKIEYRWRGVRLITTQIPGYHNSTTKGIAIGPPSGFPIKEIDPPVRYMALGADRFGAGYFDASNGILYRWRDVEFHKSELPQDALKTRLVIDPQWFAITEVPPPPQYAARVPTQQPSRHGIPSGIDPGRASRSETGRKLLIDVVDTRDQHRRYVVAASVLVLILGCGSFAFHRRRMTKR